MANSDLVFYVKLHVKPECVEEWKRAVNQVIELMSTEDTFVTCYLHQDQQDKNLFTIYERWSEPTVDSFLKNQMKPYRRDYEAKLPALLQRPRETSILAPLGEWRKLTK